MAQLLHVERPAPVTDNTEQTIIKPSKRHGQTDSESVLTPVLSLFFM